jgi:hydrogenase maturation protease
MSESLVICIGNEGRGDDGVAHEVARRLGDLPDSARVLCATALDVSHAPDVAAAARLIVIDAIRRHEPAVTVESVAPGPHPRMGSHGLSPAELLTIARDLYDSAPSAWIVEVAAPQMGHSEGLSEIAREAARKAASRTREMLLEQPERG